ncbi:kinase-like protein [Gigaspora margarita]|uniref:Kinase-like protein n=1 Tax=Gigaspora margarita TaxID=4874 RepID=A0A8H4B3K9_GIGMA|nr:kinase-like protein [Gigaspora margarita]
MDKDNELEHCLDSTKEGIFEQNNCEEFYQDTVDLDKKTFEWYLNSAEDGDPNEQRNLGICYETGIGTDKDEKKAFEWYLKSAKGDNSNGQCNLGPCYMYGIGTEKDEEKAFEWYLKSAEGGIAKDENKAFEYYLKSAEEGNSAGRCNLGYCYQNAIGTVKNEKEAFEWDR